VTGNEAAARARKLWQREVRALVREAGSLGGRSADGSLGGRSADTPEPVESPESSPRLAVGAAPGSVSSSLTLSMPRRRARVPHVRRGAGHDPGSGGQGGSPAEAAVDRRLGRLSRLAGSMEGHGVLGGQGGVTVDELIGMVRREVLRAD